MGTWGFIILIVGAVVLGFAAQMIGKARYTYEWLMAGVAALVGAFVASEWLGVASTWGPEYDGLFLLPALIGAVVVAGIVELVVRMTSATTA